jgi:hypothetical protein
MHGLWQRSEAKPRMNPLLYLDLNSTIYCMGKLMAGRPLNEDELDAFKKLMDLLTDTLSAIQTGIEPALHKEKDE